MFMEENNEFKIINKVFNFSFSDDAVNQNEYSDHPEANSTIV